MVLALRKATTLCLGSFSGWKLPLKTFHGYLTVADPGEGSGGPPAPLMLRPNWGPKGGKFFFETAPSPPPPLSGGLDPPLPQTQQNETWVGGFDGRFKSVGQVRNPKWSQPIMKQYMYLTVEITLCMCAGALMCGILPSFGHSVFKFPPLVKGVFR